MTEVTRPRNDAHAAQTLADAPFLAYCMLQAMKLFMGLIRKRWPELQ